MVEYELINPAAKCGLPCVYHTTSPGVTQFQVLIMSEPLTRSGSGTIYNFRHKVKALRSGIGIVNPINAPSLWSEYRRNSFAQLIAFRKIVDRNRWGHDCPSPFNAGAAFLGLFIGNGLGQIRIEIGETALVVINRYSSDAKFGVVVGSRIVPIAAQVGIVKIRRNSSAVTHPVLHRHVAA